MIILNVWFIPFKISASYIGDFFLLGTRLHSEVLWPRAFISTYPEALMSEAATEAVGKVFPALTTKSHFPLEADKTPHLGLL